jgi:hypothetical protein
MKRLIIICEGQTEVEFCKDVLFKHFISKGIILQTPLIKKSGASDLCFTKKIVGN